MSGDELADVADRLVRMRRSLELEPPESPAWVAIVAWLEEIEGSVRAAGLDPDSLARSAEWLRTRPHRMPIS